MQKTHGRTKQLLLAWFFVGCGASEAASSQPEATPVGDVVGTPVEQVVGPSGASLTSSDAQLTLDIPEGALAAETAIQIQPISNTAWGGRGTAYRLLPHGQQFQSPVRIRLKYGEAEVAGTAAEALRIAYQDDNGLWQRYKTVDLDTGAQEISVTATHFSDWSRVHGAQLVPGSATVAANDRLDLAVEYCQGVDDGGGLLTSLARCERVEQGDVLTATGWSVNGIAGGNAQVGVVSGNEVGATFTAPPSAPPNNPVAVSSSVNALPPSRITLTSNVLVSGGKTWAGQVSADVTSPLPGGMGVATETVNTVVRFVEDPRFPGSGSFALSDGTFSANYNLNSTNYGGCTTQGTKAGALSTGPGGIPAGSLTISDFPGGGPAQYSLNITVIDAYDGTSDCNDQHMVTELMGFLPVTGPAVPPSSFQSGATEINETVIVSGLAGGTITVRIALKQL